MPPADRKRNGTDAGLVEGTLVPAAKPRTEVPAGGSGADASIQEVEDGRPAKPEAEEVFGYLHSSPASSPIGVVTKHVVPWVDYMLFEKMKRCVYFFIAKRIAKGTYLSRRLESVEFRLFQFL